MVDFGGVRNLPVTSIHPSARGFHTAADDYERSRPDYPDAAARWLAERLDLRAARTVVDIAAGTGKLTRVLVATGANVVAPGHHARSPEWQVARRVRAHEPLGARRGGRASTCPAARSRGRGREGGLDQLHRRPGRRSPCRGARSRPSHGQRVPRADRAALYLRAFRLAAAPVTRLGAGGIKPVGSARPRSVTRFSSPRALATHRRRRSPCSRTRRPSGRGSRAPSRSHRDRRSASRRS